jgi:hypothetical protein
LYFSKYPRWLLIFPGGTWSIVQAQLARLHFWFLWLMFLHEFVAIITINSMWVQAHLALG